MMRHTHKAVAGILHATCNLLWVARRPTTLDHWQTLEERYGWKQMRITLGVLVMLFLGTVPAWAALGEYESSVSLDQQAMRGEVRTEVRQGYKLQQIISPNGTIVREYISPQGIVFGIAWKGHFAPDMQQLLGSSYVELQQALQSRTPRRGAPLIVRTDKLVFVSGGHMRAYYGHAYVPNLVPNNLSAEVVR
jgi:hypothetical protein